MEGCVEIRLLLTLFAGILSQIQFFPDFIHYWSSNFNKNICLKFKYVRDIFIQLAFGSHQKSGARCTLSKSIEYLFSNTSILYSEEIHQQANMAHGFLAMNLTF